MTLFAFKRKLYNRLLEINPKLTVFKTNELANRLLQVEDALQQNLFEWIENKPLSDIWINDKYCVGAVMQMRGNKDFISALITLDDYAKGKEKESALWN